MGAGVAMRKPSYNEKVRAYIGFRKWCIEQASIESSVIPGDTTLFQRALAIHDWVLSDPEPVENWEYGPYFSTLSIEGVESQLRDLKSRIEADGGELAKIYISTLALREDNADELLYKRGGMPNIVEEK